MHMIRVPLLLLLLSLLLTVQPFYLFDANICLLLLRLVVKIGWRFLWSHCEAFYGMYLYILYNTNHHHHHYHQQHQHQHHYNTFSLTEYNREKYKWIQINASNMKFNETRCQMSSSIKICVFVYMCVCVCVMVSQWIQVNTIQCYTSNTHIHDMSI